MGELISGSLSLHVFCVIFRTILCDFVLPQLTILLHDVIILIVEVCASSHCPVPQNGLFCEGGMGGKNGSRFDRGDGNGAFSHNQRACEAAERLLKETGCAAVVHPTGTGKFFIAFHLAGAHP